MNYHGSYALCNICSVISLCQTSICWITGWSKETVNCNTSDVLKNAKTGQITNKVQEFILGGLIIYHYFTCCQKKTSQQNKLSLFSEINWKWLNIRCVKKLFNIQLILNHFWRTQQKNWSHIIQSVLKVVYIMRTQNYIIFFFKIMVTLVWKILCFWKVP